MDKWIYAASYNTGVGVELADGRKLTVFAGPMGVSLDVNGTKYTGAEKFTGIGISMSKDLKLDFKSAGT